MNHQELEQILSGQKKVTELPKSVEADFDSLLNNKFKDRYKKIIRGFEMSERKNSPTNFVFSFGFNKQIKLHMRLHDGSYYGHHPDQPFQSVHIVYADGGVHHGSAYGNPTDDVTRNTTIKHIKTLIPKIEEIYSNIEAVADEHRKEEIKSRIEQLKSKASTKLRDLKFELKEIKEFIKKYELGSRLDFLIEEKTSQIEKESQRLQTLPEFRNPEKVLGLE